jgi:hypothetical protein
LRRFLCGTPFLQYFDLVLLFLSFRLALLKRNQIVVLEFGKQPLGIRLQLVLVASNLLVSASFLANTSLKLSRLTSACNEAASPDTGAEAAAGAAEAFFFNPSITSLRFVFSIYQEASSALLRFLLDE